MMTHDPGREVPSSDLPPTKPMKVERSPQGGAWIAALVITAVLAVAGYFYLQPDMPSPAMRATEAPATAPKPN
jgi:hypothetical protein